MVVAGKGLDRFEESPHGLHKLFETAEAVVSGHRVMKLFPQPLDSVDPWIVGGLEQ